jgi:hypothetical protein
MQVYIFLEKLLQDVNRLKDALAFLTVSLDVTVQEKIDVTPWTKLVWRRNQHMTTERTQGPASGGSERIDDAL